MHITPVLAAVARNSNGCLQESRRHTARSAGGRADLQPKGLLRQNNFAVVLTATCMPTDAVTALGCMKHDLLESLSQWCNCN
jgi:hypothetical protein